MKVALQEQQQFRASVCSWQLARSLDKRQGHEAFVADYRQAYFNAEVRKGEQLYVHLKGGPQKNYCRTADVWCGRCARS